MNYKDTLMYREIAQQPEVLRACSDYNEKTLDTLAEELKKSAPAGIYLAARGTSDHAGVYFKYVCETVWGVPVSFAAPSVLSLYGGKLDLSGQLVIGVSQSGKAADVLEVLRRGNACGAITVSVTNDESSPLAKEAKYHLFCNAGEERSVAATKTFTAQAMLLTRIIERVTGDKTLKAELDAAAGLVADSLKQETAIAAASARFTGDRDCYVLGRGMVYGLVLEASLKLQETTYIRSKSYASSDFHHGPFAVMDEGTKVLMLAPADEAAGDAFEMVKKLAGVKADITLLTNDAKAFEGLYTAKITAGEGAGRYNAFFAFAPVVQLFACTLATAKGMSPDSPRGLKKVTITK